MSPVSDFHRKYPGFRQPVQDVQHLRTGHGQEVRGPPAGLHASVSLSLTMKTQSSSIKVMPSFFNF